MYIDYWQKQKKSLLVVYLVFSPLPHPGIIKHLLYNLFIFYDNTLLYRWVRKESIVTYPLIDICPHAACRQPS